VRIDTVRPGEPGLVRLLGTDPLDELSENMSTSLEGRFAQRVRLPVRR